MMTRVLTGTYSAGYSLSAAFSVLYVTGSAYVGGTGIIASAPAEVANVGTILAAVGAVGHFEGGSGYTGVDLAAGGQVFNVSTIGGGAGGAGGVNPANGNAYAGGRGGGRGSSFRRRAASPITALSSAAPAGTAAAGATASAGLAAVRPAMGSCCIRPAMS